MPPKESKDKSQQQQQSQSEEQPVADENKTKKPIGAPKRQKIVKACKDCRRRKVCQDNGAWCCWVGDSN